MRLSPMARLAVCASALVALVLAGQTLLAPAKAQQAPSCASVPASQPPAVQTFAVVQEFPHDVVFTQGLVFDRICNGSSKASCRDVYHESTGLYGESEVRTVDLATGVPLRRTRMSRQWFGEGLAKVGNDLYQLTWQGPTGFKYSAKDLSPSGTFATPLRDGWGAATDGGLLVLSDGSSTLTWVDPAQNMARVKAVTVKTGNTPVPMLNELEMVDGEVWANVWYTDCIARVCPATGRVVGWVLLHGLREALAARNLPMNGRQLDVLNGISYDPVKRRLFITGKNWPRLFEVQTRPVANPNDPAVQARVRSCIQDPNMFG